MAAVINAPFSIDRRAVMRAFSRAAPGYEAAARLERQVRAELLDRLQFFPLKPAQVLDLGAASCESTRQLRQRFPRAQVLAIDIAEAMLRAAPRRAGRGNAPDSPVSAPTRRRCRCARTASI